MARTLVRRKGVSARVQRRSQQSASRASIGVTAVTSSGMTEQGAACPTINPRRRHALRRALGRPCPPVRRPLCIAETDEFRQCGEPEALAGAYNRSWASSPPPEPLGLPTWVEVRQPQVTRLPRRLDSGPMCDRAGTRWTGSMIERHATQRRFHVNVRVEQTSAETMPVELGEHGQDTHPRSGRRKATRPGVRRVGALVASLVLAGVGTVHASRRRPPPVPTNPSSTRGHPPPPPRRPVTSARKPGTSRTPRTCPARRAASSSAPSSARMAAARPTARHVSSRRATSSGSRTGAPTA